MRHVRFSTVLLAILASGTASAASTVDQSTPADGVSAIGLGFDPWVQTFTAGRSGQLTSVVVPLSVLDDGSSSVPDGVTVSIRATEPGTVYQTDGFDYSVVTTQPVAGESLASVSVDTSTLPAYSTTAAGTTVTFATPPTVTAGTTYALHIQASTAEYGLYWSVSSPAAPADAYADGSIYMSSGSTWYELGYQPSPEGTVAHIDAAFTTYVTVPCDVTLPRWLALLLTRILAYFGITVCVA